MNVFNPKSVIVSNMPFHCFVGEKCTFLGKLAFNNYHNDFKYDEQNHFQYLLLWKVYILCFWSLLMMNFYIMKRTLLELRMHQKKDWKWKCLSVDASRAGGGILEVAILADKNHVPHTLEDLGKGIYEVSFVGEEAVRHRVHLTFNEIYIPGIFSHFLRSMFKWFF